MTDPLFKDEQSVTPQATPELEQTPAPTSNDLFTDQLAAIKNESGAQKYDTPEKALEALKHSQQYIPELKSKVDTQEQMINELQAKLEAMKSVEDVITKQEPQQSNEPTNSALGQEDILKLVSEELAKRNVQGVQESNQSKVHSTLVAKYGDNAQAEIIKKAREFNMKPSELGELSKSNPAMVLSLFGEKVGTTPASTTSYHIPADAPVIEPVKRPVKSILAGATAQEQAAHMAEIRAEVYRKHGIKE
tara:strand:- start:36966 stop:37709 length:744 start_codon:yes stop_codon:yes gene_type:complete